MAKSDTEDTTWEARQKPTNSEVLSVLGNVANREADELIGLYKSASAAWDAWSPPYDVTPSPSNWTYVYDREADRAWRIMEATATELASRKPDKLRSTEETVAVLAEWFSICSDNPAIAAGIVALLEHDRATREQLRAGRDSGEPLASFLEADKTARDVFNKSEDENDNEPDEGASLADTARFLDAIKHLSPAEKVTLAEKMEAGAEPEALAAFVASTELWAERRLAVIKQRQLVAEYPGKGNGMRSDPETEAADAALDAVNLAITDADSRIASATVTGAPDALAAATLVGLCNFMERRHSVQCDDMEIQMLKGVLRGLRPQLSGQLADDVDAVLCPTIATYGDLPFVAH